MRLPLWKRLLYSAIVVTIVLSVPEAIFRWTDLDRRLFTRAFEDYYATHRSGWLSMLTDDPVLYWKGRPFARLPGTEEFLNDRGFRGDSFRNEKPKGMRRIVCMGDSSTFGLVSNQGGVLTYNPTYSAELQRLLNEDRQVQGVEVINAGIIGYSTLQGLRQLKHHVRHWDPDVITIRYGVNDHLRPGATYVTAVEPRNSIVRWAQDTLLETRSYQLLVRLKNSGQWPAAATTLPQPSDEPLPDGALLQVEVPLAEFEFNLRRLVVEGRATGARIVLITAPLAPLVPEITANINALAMTGYSSWEALVAEHRRYEDVVRRVATELDVALLDTSRQFAERGLEKFFSGYDIAHPNGDGHIAIAQDLAALIRPKLPDNGVGAAPY